MTEGKLSVTKVNSTKFTKPYLKGEDPWLPFAGTNGLNRRDTVLYVKGERSEDLISGEVTIEWSLRMKSWSLGQPYTITSYHKIASKLDLAPLEAIFDKLSWSKETLPKRGTTDE